MNISLEKIQSHLRGLQEVVINVDTYITMLGDVFAIETNNENILVGFPTFRYSIVSSFVRSTLILLNVLFDDNAERGIPKFIKQGIHFINQSNDFSTDKKQEFLDFQHSYNNDVGKYSDLLERIKTQRDKYWAHLDKKSFDNPTSFFLNFPIQFNELLQLLDFAKTTLKSFYICIFSIASDMYVIGRHELQSLIELASENHRLKIELGEQDNLISELRSKYA